MRRVFWSATSNVDLTGSETCRISRVNLPVEVGSLVIPAQCP